MAEQQPEVIKHLKQLENQNNKLRRLLKTALEVADKDAASLTRLKQESEVLEGEVLDLEKEKLQLETILAVVKPDDPDDMDQTIYKLEKEHVELRSKLEEVLTEIRKGNLEIDELKSQDAELKVTILRLENEKKSLLEQLKIVEKKESVLSEIGNKLKERVSEIEQKEALIMMAETKEDTIKRQPKFIKHLGVPTTLVDIIKDRLYDELQETIARSTEEINQMKITLSDPDITKLMNDIEVQKNVLLQNLKLLKLKEDREEDIIPLLPKPSEIETRAVDLGPSGSGLEENQYKEEPSTSSDQLKLDELVLRLEYERSILLKRLHSISETSAQQYEERQNELHSTFMREISSEELVDSTKKYDDATNQLYADEEARLEQRIRELEAENDRIKKELDELVTQIKKDDIITPQYMISLQLKEKIAEMEKQESILRKSLSEN